MYFSKKYTDAFIGSFLALFQISPFLSQLGSSQGSGDKAPPPDAFQFLQAQTGPVGPRGPPGTKHTYYRFLTVLTIASLLHE